jgi:hypothetical protein
MYYGHSPWIALVIFGGIFAVRFLSSQRRRGGHRPGATSGSSLTGPHRQGPTGRPVTASQRAGGSAFTGAAPGWFRDPFFRHEQRYWSGTEWTEHVTDDGAPGTDSPPRPGRPGA